MTVREYRLREMGYMRMVNEERRNARWVGYQVLAMGADPDKLPPIHKVWPIDGDPTDEEIEAAKEKQATQDKQWARDLMEEMVRRGTLKKKATTWKKDSK
jgi:hypothetical protein